MSVIGVWETWLISFMVSSFVKLPGYKFYRGEVDGVVRNHGVGVYVSCSMKCVAVDVTLPNVSGVHLIDVDVTVVVCYRPLSYTFHTVAPCLLKFRGGQTVV